MFGIEREKKICIDPGHGGARDGARYGKVEEDDLNLQVALYLYYELKLSDYLPILTREKDQELAGTLNEDLKARVFLANQEQADLFISIHCDAFHKESAKGQTIHIHPSASDDTRHFAYMLDGCLRTVVPDRHHRGVRESNFYVLRKTAMPSVLVECEFLSNPESRKWIHEPENLRSIAIGIEFAVEKFFTSPMTIKNIEFSEGEEG